MMLFLKGNVLLCKFWTGSSWRFSFISFCIKPCHSLLILQKPWRSKTWGLLITAHYLNCWSTWRQTNRMRKGPNSQQRTAKQQLLFFWWSPGQQVYTTYQTHTLTTDCKGSTTMGGITIRKTSTGRTGKRFRAHEYKIKWVMGQVPSNSRNECSLENFEYITFHLL